MARLITGGFEWNSIYADASPYVTGTATIAAAAARTGSYGLRLGDSQFIGYTIPGAVVSRTYFHRFYLRTSAAPAVASRLWVASDLSSGLDPFLRLNTDLTLQAMYDTNSPVALGSPSAALSTNTWYRIECSYRINTSTNDDAFEVLIDGTSLASSTTLNLGTGAIVRFAIGSSAQAHGVNLDFDDIAVNDDQGASQNSWPGSGNVVLCLPISDSQDGSWTGGAGGTGIDLSLAVKNTPPTGTATETDTTQIESIDASGDNATDEYRANLTTYTNAGIGGSDTITLIQPMCIHGEDVGTGTKTGSLGLQANPSQTYATFTYADDIGALATFGGAFDTNWKTKNGAPVYAPSVTLGSSPVLAVRKTDAGTRVASVCAMGLYVDYIPAAGGATEDVFPYVGGGYFPT
jgi:hypothetical protein